MKKNLLVMFLVLTFLLTVCATAEKIELDIVDDEVNIPIVEIDDLLITGDGLSDEIDVSDNLEIDVLGLPAESEAPAIDNEAVGNDDSDFQIINGILVKYNGNGGDITIPSGVTIIGAEAFRFDSSITSVTIPDGVTSIGKEAFRECSSLYKVEMPDSITSIEDHAFYECSMLSEIDLPDSLISIGQYAFYKCTCLKSIGIPNSLWLIDDNAFSDCSSLSSVNLSEGFTSFGSNMFENCIILKEIIVPSSVRDIDYGVFKNCRSLNRITIESDMISISDGAFEGIPSSAVFHTHCETPATKWAESKGYSVIKSDHTPVTDKAVAPTYDKTGLTEGKHCSVCGTVLEAQKVVPKLPKTSLSKAKITVKDKVYTGKALNPAVTVKLGNVKLKKNTDYTVTYKNNTNVSTATVVVKGKGKYTGSAKATFAINPKKLAISKLTAGKQQLTVNWKKQSGITGYEIEYSLNKSFKNSKTIKAKKTKTSVTIKKLTGGKKYYVRIRAYKDVKKKTYYSAWSAAKNVKVKK